MSEDILLLHPGEMGSSIGAALRSNGHTVRWVAGGRSGRTKQRASDAGLAEGADLKTAIAEVDHVISVCPPHAALDVAATVAGTGFDGTYVDANAISPDTARGVRDTVGAGFVDGGIVGPPAWRTGTTRLYLSGADADRVAAQVQLFEMREFWNREFVLVWIEFFANCEQYLDLNPPPRG